MKWYSELCEEIFVVDILCCLKRRHGFSHFSGPDNLDLSEALHWKYRLVSFPSSFSFPAGLARASMIRRQNIIPSHFNSVSHSFFIQCILRVWLLPYHQHSPRHQPSNLASIRFHISQNTPSISERCIKPQPVPVNNTSASDIKHCYSSSWKHLLRQKQWFLKHKMGFLHVIVPFLGGACCHDIVSTALWGHRYSVDDRGVNDWACCRNPLCKPFMFSRCSREWLPTNRVHLIRIELIHRTKRMSLTSLSRLYEAAGSYFPYQSFVKKGNRQQSEIGMKTANMPDSAKGLSKSFDVNLVRIYVMCQNMPEFPGLLSARTGTQRSALSATSLCICRSSWKTPTARQSPLMLSQRKLWQIWGGRSATGSQESLQQPSWLLARYSETRFQSVSTPSRTAPRSTVLFLSREDTK